MRNLLIIFGAKYLIYVMIVIFVIAFFLLAKNKKKDAILFAALVLPFSYLLNKTLSFFFYNPRPFVENNFTPLVDHVADNGFPSEHTLLAFSIAAISFYMNKKITAFFIAAALVVGISRVLAGVHHTLDVLGSIGIVILVALLVYYFQNKK